MQPSQIDNALERAWERWQERNEHFSEESIEQAFESLVSVTGSAAFDLYAQTRHNMWRKFYNEKLLDIMCLCRAMLLYENNPAKWR